MVVVGMEAAAVQLCSLSICLSGARRVPPGSQYATLHSAQMIFHGHGDSTALGRG